MSAMCLCLLSCADEEIVENWNIQPQAETSDAISFSGSVVTSRMVTKADGSLRDRNETGFQTTEDNGGFQVGLFGAYTGVNTWDDLMTIAAKASPTAAETKTLSQHYTANLFFNQPADIVAGSELSYTPVRFWPNGKINSTEYHRATFWAYYPYNATGDPGDLGVHITTDNIGTGGGMGQIKFTMHTDASEQSDFMISDLKADCNKNTYPLTTTYGPPTSVPLTFHHMLAQVRVYALMTGMDRVVYQRDGEDNVIQADRTWMAAQSVGATIKDVWGTTYEKTGADEVTNNVTEETMTLDEFAELELSVPDESNSVRWARTAVKDPTTTGYYADVNYSVSFGNIYTSCLFTPTVTYSAGTYTTTVTSEKQGSLGSATVNDYVPNPEWFTPLYNGKRVMVNTDHMYGDAYYNRGNIILAVPQVISDDDVPNVAITIRGEDTSGNEVTARVTYNMLQMDIKWESGFIYCYAFLEELMPGDDKVKGPENIIVVFDPDKITDQW